MHREPGSHPPVPDTVPSALPSALFQEVQQTWVAGRAACDPQYPPLRSAIERLARAAREREVPVSDVLRALDAVCRSHLGGDSSLDWDHVRAWAGGLTIRAYYRDD